MASTLTMVAMGFCNGVDFDTVARAKAEDVGTSGRDYTGARLKPWNKGNGDR